ncbi:WW domain binding protein 1-like a [Triplophysa rosa]|uniref:WW domain binding protein 1-like n=1 Tax=Triplophysa rosa TaxID=992332 RepID=A0A9W8C187_TRIRA|nr:WW domain binding protein 1-like a [Triplophysa rosa]KAI7805348.1 WW domain binding protein 1-like [Triplophysa rosa]
MSCRLADVSKVTGMGGMWGVQYIRLGMGLFISNAVIGPVGSVSAEAALTENRLLCIGVNNQSYYCNSGYCCEESQCCNNFYEVWWFWLVLTLIVILACCCVCHHRRAKHRLQQQQRQHEINLIAYREAHNYTSVPFYFRFLPGYLLPPYEEVENRPPTPPPPYSASQPGQSTSTDPLCSDPPNELCSPLQSSPVASASENSSPRPGMEQTHSPTTHRPTRNTHKPYLNLEEDGQLQQVACATSHSLVKQGGSSEDLTKPGDQSLDCSPDSKDKTPGRHRRFTGDSGIEVCVCSQGPGDEEEMKELVGHIDGEMLEEQDFCDSCNPRCIGPGDEEQVPATSDGALEHRESQRPPVSLHLHTINEQEGPHQGNNMDPQS